MARTTINGINKGRQKTKNKDDWLQRMNNENTMKELRQANKA